MDHKRECDQKKTMKKEALETRQDYQLAKYQAGLHAIKGVSVCCIDFGLEKA
jgi:hypothetical protein